jgi:hypothetical protein
VHTVCLRTHGRQRLRLAATRQGSAGPQSDQGARHRAGPTADAAGRHAGALTLASRQVGGMAKR